MCVARRTKLCKLMLTICCILSVGGPASITPVTFKKVILQKQPYRTTSDFNPVSNPYLREPPSTPALELSIVLFAASFPMRLVKSRLVLSAILAAITDGARPAASSDEPNASKGSQTSHCAPLGRRGSALLGELSHRS